MDFEARLGRRLDAIIAPPIVEAREGQETRTYKITSRPHNLDRLEKLFGWASYLGKVGHSGAAEFSVDGDGSGQMTFERGGKEIEKPDDYDSEHTSSGIEYHTGLD
jgi:hypothetical protein